MTRLCNVQFHHPDLKFGKYTLQPGDGYRRHLTRATAEAHASFKLLIGGQEVDLRRGLYEVTVDVIQPPMTKLALEVLDGRGELKLTLHGSMT